MRIHPARRDGYMRPAGSATPLAWLAPPWTLAAAESPSKQALMQAPGTFAEVPHNA